MALAGEVGELAARVQWVPDAEIAEALQDPRFHTAFADELADCLSYLVQIADGAGIDLAEAFNAKLAQNADKYPVHLARGNATKYTELKKGSSA